MAEHPDAPLPPPCPPPSRFVRINAKRFPQAQAEAAGDAVLGLKPRKNQPFSRPEAMAAVSAADDAAFAAIEVALGGRVQVAALLAAADLSGHASELPALLSDPANDNLSLARLAAWARVPLRRFYELLKDAALLKGHMRALVKVGELLPDVALGVMEDSIPGERTCPACRGLGQLQDDPTPDDPNPGPRKCKACSGSGSVPYRPETELRKVALQIGKLLDKPGNTNNVFVAQKFGAGTAQPFSQMVGELDTLLNRSTRDRFGRTIVDAPAADADDPAVEGD